MYAPQMTEAVDPKSGRWVFLGKRMRTEKRNRKKTPIEKRNALVSLPGMFHDAEIASGTLARAK